MIFCVSIVTAENKLSTGKKLHVESKLGKAAFDSKQASSPLNNNHSAMVIMEDDLLNVCDVTVKQLQRHKNTRVRGNVSAFVQYRASLRN